jgi:hypothetical protein
MNSYSKTLDIINNEILPYWKGECKMIDIGGGMKDINDIIKLSSIMNNYIINSNIKWIAEPGRYFSNNSIDLYTKIIRVNPDNSLEIVKELEPFGRTPTAVKIEGQYLYYCSFDNLQLFYTTDDMMEDKTTKDSLIKPNIKLC